MPTPEYNHRFDYLKGEPEHRSETGEISGIVEVQQIGDLVLHEEPGRVDLVEVDQENLLEHRRALEVTRSNSEHVDRPAMQAPPCRRNIWTAAEMVENPYGRQATALSPNRKPSVNTGRREREPPHAPPCRRLPLQTRYRCRTL